MDAIQPAIRDEIVTAFREYRNTIYSIARRYCGEYSAADVTQEVFLRVWNNPTGFDAARGSMRQYLCTLARGISIDHLRRQHARTNREHKHAHHTDIDAADLSHRLLHSETAAQIESALARLHSGERHAIVMAFFNDMTYREVAIRMGVAEGTAKSRIRSGLTKLRKDLETELI